MSAATECSVDPSSMAWGSIVDACAILRRSPSSLLKLRKAGLVRSRRPPGLGTFVNLDDCRRLAAREFEAIQSDHA